MRKNKFLQGLLLLYRVLGLILIVVLLLAGIWITIRPTRTPQEMELFFVGTKDDADSIILSNRGHHIMIDTGEAEDSAHIAEILDQNGIEVIDCLILTHPDKDHIGGAVEIMKRCQVKMVVEPYCEQENERMKEVHRYMEDQSIAKLIPSRNRSFTYGDIRLRIYPPEEFEYGKDNNYSLAVEVKHKNVTLFLPGDAEKKRTDELMKLDLKNVDLYKASYHGRDYEGGIGLLQKLNPKIVVVTAEKAGKETEKELEKMQIPVYYTKGKDLVLKSDGEMIIP